MEKNRDAEKVSRHLIVLAEIKPGSIVLDIATGVGEPAVTTANWVDKNGHIFAIDISPQKLSVAKQSHLFRSTKSDLI